MTPSISRSWSLLLGSIALLCALLGAVLAVRIMESHRETAGVVMTEVGQDTLTAPIVSLPVGGEQRVIEMIWAFWIFLFGACIGSFLNVVIYRVPQHISIVSKPSYCPSCRTNIRFRDNVPIWGWLWLRGRCRQCRQPISARYPIVEFTVALLFQALYIGDVVRAYSIQPSMVSSAENVGILGLFVANHWIPLATFGFHAFTLSVLVVITLMAWDGVSPSKSMHGFIVPVAFAIGQFWPALYPFSPDQLPWQANVASSANIRLAPLVGALAGLVIGWLLRTVRLRWMPEARVSADSAFWAMLVIGVTNGWQITVGAAVAAVVIDICFGLFARFRRYPQQIPFAASLLVAWLAMLVVIRW